MSGSRIWGLGISADGENEVMHMNLWCTAKRQFGTTRQWPVRNEVHFWLLRDGVLWVLFECEPLVACYIDIKGVAVLLF